jgi:hypothetical protein
MNPYLVAPGIRFDNYVFGEPRRLTEVAIPKCAGVLAILIRDPNWAPKSFQPLCFREFGNNPQATLPPGDAIRLARISQADELFVSVLALPFSTAGQRREILDELIRAYNPCCQTVGPPLFQNDLVHKLDELEKKNEEQTIQVRLLLDSIHRLFGPQAEPRRRTIGFLPEPAATN